MAQKTFWNEDGTKVFTLERSLLNNISDTINDIWKCLTSVSTLFRYDDHVRVSLESTLQSKM